MKITLKAARINAGITLVDAAKHLERSYTTLSRWESGETDIPSRDFRKLCSLYKVEERDIFLPSEVPKSQF